MKRRMNKELNNLLFIIFKIWLAEKLQIEVFQSIVEVNFGRKKEIGTQGCRSRNFLYTDYLAYPIRLNLICGRSWQGRRSKAMKGSWPRLPS
jgi:hypothetical protein